MKEEICTTEDKSQIPKFTPSLKIIGECLLKRIKKHIKVEYTVNITSLGGLIWFVILFIINPVAVTNFIYEFFRFFKQYSTLIVFLGLINIVIILWSLWSLKNVEGSKKRGELQQENGGSDLFGCILRPVAILCLYASIFSLILALLVPINLLHITRFPDARVAIIRSNSMTDLPTIIKQELGSLEVNNTEKYYFDDFLIPEKESVFEKLLAISKKNYDVVIIDVHNPFKGSDYERLTKLLNPYTLYILTSQLNCSAIDKFPNIVSLSPNIIREISQICQLIPTNANRIEVYLTEEPTEIDLQSVFLHFLPDNLHNNVKLTKKISNKSEIVAQNDTVAVFLDWELDPKKILKNLNVCTNFSVIAPSQIIGDNKIKTPIITNYSNRYPASICLRDLQSQWIQKLLATHFCNNRPLNLNETIRDANRAMLGNDYPPMTIFRQASYKYTQ